MNQRQFVRNLGRIPRLLLHIERCKDNPERVAGFEAELERRKMEMKLADLNEKSEAHPEDYVFKNYGEVLENLLQIKLEAHVTPDSEYLKEWIARESVGMAPGIAELTPAAG